MDEPLARRYLLLVELIHAVHGGTGRFSTTMNAPISDYRRRFRLRTVSARLARSDDPGIIGYRQVASWGFIPACFWSLVGVLADWVGAADVSAFLARCAGDSFLRSSQGLSHDEQADRSP
ncbi:MAG: hypothetical protein ACYDG8_11920, partial [Vulcanimicrobiaceae bacterium]